MSGGFFDYKQNHISEIADDVQRLIDDNDYNYPPEVISEFRRGVRALRIARIYAQRIDWLVSSDDSEESFLNRLLEDLSEAK